MVDNILVTITEDTITTVVEDDGILVSFRGIDVLDHNSQSGLQGGSAALNEFWHLTSTDHGLLIGGADTTLHFHNSDRDLGNAFGTMTTDLLMGNNSIEAVRSIMFDLDDGTPREEGRMIWNSEDGTLEFGLPGGVVNLQIGQELLFRAKNESGNEIVNGSPIFISGASGSRPEIDLATTSPAATSGAIGLVTESIDNAQSGYVVTVGLIRDIDTSAIAAGGRVFLSDTPGEFTNVLPAAANRKVFLGINLRQHATEGIMYTSPVNIFYPQELSGVEIIGALGASEAFLYNTTTETWQNTYIGTMAFQDADAVAITGGSIVGITELGVGTATPDGKLHVKGAADEVQMVVQGNATQTANLQEWQNSSGVVLSAIDEDGKLILYGSSGVPAGIIDSPGATDIILYSNGGSNQVFRGTFANSWVDGVGTNFFQLGSAGGISMFTSGGGSALSRLGIVSSEVMISNVSSHFQLPVPLALLHVFNVKAAKVAVIIRASGGQTANLQEWHDSSEVAQLALAANGRDFVLDTTTGTKWGTATSQKQAWWGATPVVRPTGVAVTAAAIHAALVSLGLIAA